MKGGGCERGKFGGWLILVPQVVMLVSRCRGLMQRAWLVTLTIKLSISTPSSAHRYEHGEIVRLLLV